VSTTQAHRLDPGDAARPAHGELPSEPLVQGAGRGRGRRSPFDLAAFVLALEHHDLAYQLARYAPDALIRVVDPDSPPPVARTIVGSRAIRSWLESSALGIKVVQLVDGGDRVAFTEHWSERDGTAVEATSTAEIDHGVITVQHTRSSPGPVPRSTRSTGGPEWAEASSPRPTD
jgi:hypothetical protein